MRQRLWETFCGCSSAMCCACWNTPPALVVVLALLVLPSVYTWYNVVGLLGPLRQHGRTLRVCVVQRGRGRVERPDRRAARGRHDRGRAAREQRSSTGRSPTATTAMAELDSRAKSYAAFVIPSGLHLRSLLSLTTGDFAQPKLEYHVNEKAGPVAPEDHRHGRVSTLERDHQLRVRVHGERRGRRRHRPGARASRAMKLDASTLAGGGKDRPGRADGGRARATTLAGIVVGHRRGAGQGGQKRRTRSAACAPNLGNGIRRAGRPCPA